MILTSTQRDILELAAEDYTGLWEVGWRLDTIRTPATVPAPAADVVRSLLDARLVELVVRQPDRTAPQKASDAIANLADPAMWKEPQVGDPAWLIGATDLGLQALTERKTQP